MGKPGIKDPSLTTSTRLIRFIFAERSVGVVGAAVVSALSVKLSRTGAIRNLPGNKGPWAVAAGGAVVGFGAGYGAVCIVQWLTWKAIKCLLAYRGWMFNPNAISTKVIGFIPCIVWGTTSTLYTKHYSLTEIEL